MSDDLLQGLLGLVVEWPLATAGSLGCLLSYHCIAGARWRAGLDRGEWGRLALSVPLRLYAMWLLLRHVEWAVVCWLLRSYWWLGVHAWRLFWRVAPLVSVMSSVVLAVTLAHQGEYGRMWVMACR